MTAPSIIDPARFLHEHLEQASPDLLTTFVNTLLSADADAVCGAWANSRPTSAGPASCCAPRPPTVSGRRPMATCASTTRSGR